MKRSSTEQRPEFVPRPHTTAGELAGSALMCSQRTGTLERWGNNSNDNHETVVTEDRVSFLRRSCLEGGQKAPETVTVLQPGLAGGEELYQMKGIMTRKNGITERQCVIKILSPQSPLAPSLLSHPPPLPWFRSSPGEPRLSQSLPPPAPMPVHCPHRCVLTFQTLDLIMSLPARTHHFLDGLSLFP